MDEDGFQINDRRRTGGRPAAVRVYLGGLPAQIDLQQELHKWLVQTLPKHISIGAIEIKQGGSIGTKQSSCFALIECGQHTNEAIRTLQGCSFEGTNLTVQRERRTGNNGHKNEKQVNPSQRRGGRERCGRGKNIGGFHSTFNKKGWAKPSETTPYLEDAINDPEEKQEIENSPPFNWEETTNQLSIMVSSEIEKAGDDADNVINATLASAAAVTYFASVLAAGDVSIDDNNDLIENHSSPIQQPIIKPNETEVSDFASFVKGQSMSALLADFGEADPGWKKVETTLLPLSSSSPQEHQAPPPDQVSRHQKFASRLAPQGKAPIHICLESFGYVHGAPSRQARDSSWSPYTQPLAPIDCRPLFAPAPSYLDFHDGLHSGQVKRVLLQQSRFGDSGNEHVGETSDRPDYKDIQDYAKRILARKEIWDALLEAQNVGGHGYVSPLQMRVLVGSQLGRHRSVVVVEWAAIELRKLLRTNKDNVVLQAVSVGTLHRDIEKRIPTRKYREDEDDDRIQ